MTATPINVVLADDHALFREGTRELLERADGIRVVGEASTGAEAVELDARERPDVTIVDIEMPDLDGVEGTRRIKAARPEAVVLVLTVHDDEPYVLAILEAGAAGYLLKDVHADELVAAVRSLHAGESVLHPAIARQVLRRVRADGDGSSRPRPEPLTSEERELLRLAASGLTNAAIAERLDVHPRTVQLRLSRLFARLGVGSRTEAVLRALQEDLCSLEDLS